MIIKWYGWGGQGIDRSARLLVDLAVAAGKQGQAFPDETPEQAGVPRCAISHVGGGPGPIPADPGSPDLTVVFDADIFDAVNVSEKPGDARKLLLNTELTPLQVKEAFYLKNAEVLTINANQIVLEETGEEHVFFPMLAAALRILQIGDFASFMDFIEQGIFPGRGAVCIEKYRRVARRSFDEIIGLWRQ